MYVIFFILRRPIDFFFFVNFYCASVIYILFVYIEFLVLYSCFKFIQFISIVYFHFISFWLDLVCFSCCKLLCCCFYYKQVANAFSLIQICRKLHSRKFFNDNQQLKRTQTKCDFFCLFVFFFIGAGNVYTVAIIV